MKWCDCCGDIEVFDDEYVCEKCENMLREAMVKVEIFKMCDDEDGYKKYMQSLIDKIGPPERDY